MSGDTDYAVLIVDDELAALNSCRRVLAAGGIEDVVCCEDSRNVMGLLARHDFGAVLLDLSMPHVSGEELLPLIGQEYPQVPVIVITGFNAVETAVECMKAGAFDYMVKPVEKSRMVSGVRRAIEMRRLQAECDLLRDRMTSDKLEHPETFEEIVTQNAAMRSLFQYAEAIAASPRPVLVTGETGVGKELMARAIHTLSGRSGPFVEVNVAGLDDTMFSDTLFGHLKGAFTGANEARTGLVERAAGGTLFLDEIGDLSPPSQVKLLRLLQQGSYLPLGSDVPKLTDAHVVLATNRDLDVLQRDGAFRRDLYYRIQTHRLHIPPLRERLDDLPVLIEHFLEQGAKTLGKPKPTAPRELTSLLRTYHFPGNVRELESMVFDALSRHTGGVMSTQTFRNHIGSWTPGPAAADEDGDPLMVFPKRFPTLDEATRFVIAEALERAENNITVAAELLGISRQALSKRLQRAGDS